MTSLVYKIEIETITPIHIGNGEFLLRGNDFIDDNENIYVLDIDKLGRMLGKDSIDQWVKAIVNNDSARFVKELMEQNGLSIKDYTLRTVPNSAAFTNTQNTLKECIRDAQYRPYIPGSSIKGAIRTAIMAPLASERIRSLNGMNQSEKSWRAAINNMERTLFVEKTKLGEVQNGVFRYLSTGDAYFVPSEDNPRLVVATNQMCLNITESKSIISDQKSKQKQQAVEVITEGQVSSFRLNVKPRFFESLPLEDGRSISDVPELFSLINESTKSLLEREKDFWSNGEGSAYEGKDIYLNNLKELCDMVDASGSGQCILRIGNAIGWRFITGGWTEFLIDVTDDAERPLFNKFVAKPVRKKSCYEKYPFPKSRRVGIDGAGLFGFVKLAIVEK